MMTEPLRRRRFLTIAAAFAGLPLLAAPDRASASQQAVVWRGRALGAPATLVLNHEDRREAERLVRQVAAEVDRLEGIFSLYCEDSILSELNRIGAIIAPPPELVDLLRVCREWHETTSGAFDPSVQPLFLLYARHFSEAFPAAEGPASPDIRRALDRIGFGSVRFDANRVAFARRGMGLTLNGVAQGYITDRIVALLQQAGVTSSLVDMGENRAIGAKADGSPWRVGLSVSEDDKTPEIVIDLIDKAVATSASAGFSFDPAGRFGHILDPRSGLTAHRYARVSVIAPDATTADILSTALSLMPVEEARILMARLPSTEASLRLMTGETVALRL